MGEERGNQMTEITVEVSSEGAMDQRKVLLLPSA